MSQSLKEIAIREYLSKIDLKSEDLKLSQVKKDMRIFLGEEPGINLEYTKDVSVNESSEEAKEFLKPQKLVVVFTDIDNKFKKLEFNL